MTKTFLGKSLGTFGVNKDAKVSSNTHSQDSKPRKQRLRTLGRTVMLELDNVYLEAEE